VGEAERAEDLRDVNAGTSPAPLRRSAAATSHANRTRRRAHLFWTGLTPSMRASALRRLGCDGAGHDDAADPDLHRRIDGAAALTRSLRDVRSPSRRGSGRVRTLATSTCHRRSWSACGIRLARATWGTVGEAAAVLPHLASGMNAYATPSAWRARRRHAPSDLADPAPTSLRWAPASYVAATA
jgi:hypothetical protein